MFPNLKRISLITLVSFLFSLLNPYLPALANAFQGIPDPPRANH